MRWIVIFVACGSAPGPSAPGVAPSEALAPETAPALLPLAPSPMAPPEVTSAIPCADVGDCWASEDGQSIARPDGRRGESFIPCEDGSAVPVCVEGRCGLVAFGC